MKTRRNIYLVLGILLTLLNIISTLTSLQEIGEHLSSDAYDIGYLIGTQFLLVIGLAFLYAAYNVQKKINNKKRRELENAFNDLPENQ